MSYSYNSYVRGRWIKWGVFALVVLILCIGSYTIATFGLTITGNHNGGFYV